jgi:hypothetical protein
MSSLLKTLIERLHSTGNSKDVRVTKQGLFFHHTDRELGGKPFVSLICCDNLEHLTTYETVSYFKTYARFMEAPQVGTLIRTSGYLFGRDQESAAIAIYPKIPEITEVYYRAGQELAIFGKITRKTETEANQKVISIPWIVKKLARFRPIQRMIISKANQMLQNPLHDAIS